MTQHAHDNAHEFSTELLPWLVNDTLNEAERERIQRHVDQCAECQRDVELLKEMQSGLQSAALSPLVATPHVDSLVTSIDMQDRMQIEKFNVQKIAIAASIAMLFIAGVVLFNQRMLESGNVQFETATTSDQVLEVDYVFNMQFEPTTLAEDRQRILDGINARDITMLESGDQVRFVVRLAAISIEDLDRYTDELEGRPEILSVTTVAVQLPVRNSDR